MTSAFSAFGPQHLEQAVAWFVALQDDHCSPQKRQRFERWLAQDVAHQAAFREAELLWSNLDEIKSASVPGLAAARDARPRRSNYAAKTLSAVCLAFLLGGAWQEYHAPLIAYHTAVGERRGVDLADGTHLELNADTQLSVRVSWLRREISLAQGEVLINVAHETLRPLMVTVGTLSIRDIGTRFDVRKRDKELSVAVLEGEVELSSAETKQSERLKAGFVRRLDEAGHILRAEAIPVEQAGAWVKGHLIFEHTPLSNVLAELAHHHALQFVLADPALAKETLSGSFDINDLNPFLHALEKILPVRAQRQKQSVVLLRR